MPDKATPQFEYEREGAGRYQVYLAQPRRRLGVLLGKSGNWCAEDTAGKTLSCFNTRSDGAKALLNHAKFEKRG